MKENQETPATMQEAVKQPEAGNAESAPAPVQPVKKSALPAKLKPIRDCLIAPKNAFIAAGGTEEEFNREVNFAAQILEKNDYLLSVAIQNPDSLITAIKNVGLTKLSLNPELKLGYLVPRKNKGVNAVYFTSSYMGKREILMRSGCVRSFEANLVYDGETFEMRKGTTSYLVHDPDPWGDHDKKHIKGGYWIAKLNNGETMFDTVSIQRILEVMNRSEAVKAGKSSPWDTDFNEMARKTILNAGFGQLPKTDISEAVLKVMEADNTYDNEEFEAWKRSVEENNETFTKDGKPSFVDYEEVK